MSGYEEKIARQHNSPIAIEWDFVQAYVLPLQSRYNHRVS